jgi:glyoxylase I family protein
MSSLIIGYRHTGIITSNMEKSVDFYHRILGLEIIQDFTDRSDYINKITNIENGEAHFVKLRGADNFVLELLEYPTHRTNLHNLSIINTGICHLALQVSSAENMYENLVKENIRVLSKPILSSEGIAKVFFCLDPDNVRVEMVEML